MIWDEFLRHFRFCDEEDSGLSDEEQERKGPKNRTKRGKHCRHLFFVFARDMKGTGVTLGTLIAQNACPQLANPATLKMKIYFVCRCSIYS